ncbi:MAG: hypothetical protein N0E59_12565 [Candidatus Thiodiazotropha taylori]|nr:hypothetical protein [Candidatus Thiodiazotropha taylori]MCG8111585.1 hypothetical protein [Candidatus Thiodiazotropha taylori]MCW4283941.1 hypothetical protein [Candidatus Thiodiazotropha taylori]MCW4306444.1 hypothetical protein [Candidatus Thiodiazotropha taylori]
MNEVGIEVPIWITVISSLASGLVTFAISTWFYMRHEERKQKIEVFRKLMGNRHGITENPDPDAKSNFFVALNEAFVVFGKSKDVLSAVMHFKAYPNRTRDNFTLLARAICNDLKIPDSTIKDEFFNEPFVPNL